MEGQSARGEALRRLAPVLGVAALMASACGGSNNDAALVGSGMQTFRYDTFNDEAFWSDTLRMHEPIAAAVDPVTALAVGLKVDADALPPGILGTVDLNSPATTVALIKMNAVVGIKGEVTAGAGGDVLTRVGVTCALCHSTVDDSVMPGIGRRIDGAANRDLNPGAIIALSPVLTAEQRAIYMSWGKGKYDPRYNIDGMSGPVMIPPAYGLKGSQHTTYTGDGDIEYWNNYVAVTQMGGQGTFVDSRIGVDKTLPAGTEDVVKPKLNALRAYQFSLTVPAAPAVDQNMADRGKNVFAQRCGGCHQGDAMTESDLHDPAEVGQDPTYALRSASKKYRTTPLRGLANHAPYFHDGSAPDLMSVVNHYDQTLTLGMVDQDKVDLAEYLKSF